MIKGFYNSDEDVALQDLTPFSVTPFSADTYLRMDR